MTSDRSIDSDTLPQGAARRRWISCTLRRLAATSLSEKSFRRYYDTCEDPVEGDGFFGWLCNRIPWYPRPESSLAADVLVQLHGQRPQLRLHHGSGNDHPLVVDQRDGITVQKAQEIAEYLRHAA